VCDGVNQLAPDVRQHTEVQLDAGPQLARVPAPLQRLAEVVAGVFDVAHPHRQPAQRVERFGRENVVFEIAGNLVAPLAQLARAGRLIAVMHDDSEPPERFGEDRLLAAPLGGRDRRFVAAYGFGNTRGPLAAACFVQQVRGTARRGRVRAALTGTGDGDCSHDNITTRSRSPRSD